MDSIQRGYRGTGHAADLQPADRRRRTGAINQVPASLPRLPDAGPKAGAVYKNVQVLGDESVGNFTRLMASITTLGVPDAGLRLLP